MWLEVAPYNSNTGAPGLSLTKANLLCRPFESGEVTVQPYNTLLSMSSLVELSSGILLLQNEVLAATCSRLLGIKHPTFKVGAAGWRLGASGQGIHQAHIKPRALVCGVQYVLVRTANMRCWLADRAMAWR